MFIEKLFINKRFQVLSKVWFEKKMRNFMPTKIDDVTASPTRKLSTCTYFASLVSGKAGNSTPTLCCKISRRISRSLSAYWKQKRMESALKPRLLHCIKKNIDNKIAL